MDVIKDGPPEKPDIIAEELREAKANLSRELRAQEEARYRLAQFITLLNNAPLGVYLVDADFRIQQVNPVALPVFGNIPNLLGRDFSEVMHLLWEERYADEVVDIFRRTLLTGEPYVTSQRAEFRADRQVTEYYEWQVNRLTLPDGRYGVVRYFRDISDHVKASQAIAESKARYQALFESIDEGFCVVQMIFNDQGRAVDYRFLEVNPSFEAQTGMHQAVGIRMRQFLPNHEEYWFEIYGKVALTGEPVRFQKRAGGLHRWYDVYAFRVGQPDDRKVAILFNDITEKREAEERLRNSEESLRLLAADLEERVKERTLELIQSQDRLRTLATGLTLAESRERKRLATDMHDHLQQILVLAKLHVGQGKRETASGRLSDIMQRVDELLSDGLKYTRTLVAELSPPVLQEHGFVAGIRWLGEYMKRHDMTVSVAVPEPLTCSIPEEQGVLLFKSVRELLVNVWKHAQTNRAEVVLDELNGELRIQVRDAGIGCADLSPTVTPVEADNEMSPKFGLYSIRERMTALGGSFQITSAPGLGTSVTLLLPAGKAVAVCPPTRQPKSVLQSRPDAHMSASPTDQRIRVLLVDDHAMMRQGLRSVLEGYPDIEVVGEAGNGEDSLACVEKLQPSIVIMDINMPGMNGIEATHLIKTRYPNIAVIGLSVNAAGENQSSMKQAGASLLLPKESAVEQLYLAIQDILRTSSSVFSSGRS